MGQKSLAEGFGLTVAEAMWKAKAVVALRVGGITMQITPGTGLLLADPTDLVAFGDTLAVLLHRPDEIAELRERARNHVLEDFVGDKRFFSTLTSLVGGQRSDRVGLYRKNLGDR